MAFNITIVDDEPWARAAIRHILRAHGMEKAVVSEADSVASALALLQSSTPHLLLLDVEMEDGTGFDLLDRLPAIDFNVVFTTAHDDFAIRAFRYNALDYLLKPIVADELLAAIRKAALSSDHALLQRQIANLLNTASARSFERIALHNGTDAVFVQTEDITCVDSYGNYTFVFLSNGERHLVARNLKEFEEMLPSPPFFRVHQSHIVNTACVQRFVKEEGSGSAILTDGRSIPVARRKRDTFLALLDG